MKVEKTLLLVPAQTMIAIHSATKQVIIAMVVECSDFKMVCRVLVTDIELTICDWVQLMKLQKLVLSPN